MAYRKPFCKYGHEIAVVGRYKSGGCKRCGADQYQQNREEIIERVKLWQKAHPEQRAATCRRWYMRNQKRRIREATLWNKAHPERRRELWRASKAKYKGVNFWVEAALKSR